jgi:hypothetical protein
VHANAEPAAIAHEFARRIEHETLFRSIENLLIAGFEAHEQQTQTIVTELLQGVVIEVRAGVA